MRLNVAETRFCRYQCDVFNMGTAHYFFSAKSVLELKAKTAPAPRATPGLKFIDILPAKFTIV